MGYEQPDFSHRYLAKCFVMIFKLGLESKVDYPFDLGGGGSSNCLRHGRNKPQCNEDILFDQMHLPY